jgi:alpha-ketoglutarate-dependent taurine dioxygenase
MEGQSGISRQLLAEQGAAGDGLQRPLLRRSRFQPRLSAGVSAQGGRKLKDWADELRDHGYVRVRAISADETTLEIAQRLGSISVISGITPAHELVPRSVEQASASSYGGMYGLGPFPLHTDMAHWHVPPRYFLLRCVHPAPQVKTLALHSRNLFDEEDEVTLRRALFRPRRRLDGRLTIDFKKKIF